VEGGGWRVEGANSGPSVFPVSTLRGEYSYSMGGIGLSLVVSGISAQT
jgi:hypothetical protein